MKLYLASCSDITFYSIEFSSWSLNPDFWKQLVFVKAIWDHEIVSIYTGFTWVQVQSERSNLFCLKPNYWIANGGIILAFSSQRSFKNTFCSISHEPYFLGFGEKKKIKQPLLFIFSRHGDIFSHHLNRSNLSTFLSVEEVVRKSDSFGEDDLAGNTLRNKQKRKAYNFTFKQSKM